MAHFSLSSDAFSFIPLIPLVSVFFLIKDRKTIFGNTGYSLFPGIAVAASGVLLHGAFIIWGGLAPKEYGLTVDAVAFLISLWGIFALFFGVDSFKKAIFPLLFLLFIIPLPSVIERLIVEMFRAGSAEMVAFYFKILGIPFFREGDTFQLEHLRFCVASQCSGINSGLSLFIVSVIAAKLFLRNNWVRLGFVLSVIPIGWSKNGLRIATLTLLGSYVNSVFLEGPLHRQGGRPFFVVALLFLGLSLFLLRMLEKRIGRKNNGK